MYFKINRQLLHFGLVTQCTVFFYIMRLNMPFFPSSSSNSAQRLFFMSCLLLFLLYLYMIKCFKRLSRCSWHRGPGIVLCVRVRQCATALLPDAALSPVQRRCRCCTAVRWRCFSCSLCAFVTDKN